MITTLVSTCRCNSSRFMLPWTSCSSPTSPCCWKCSPCKTTSGWSVASCTRCKLTLRNFLSPTTKHSLPFPPHQTHPSFCIHHLCILVSRGLLSMFQPAIPNLYFSLRWCRPLLRIEDSDASARRRVVRLWWAYAMKVMRQL